MSETDFLKLKKHDNPETNTEKFDIENYLNGNWDKINENAKKVNTDILNINSKNKEQDTNIGQLQENTETSSNKIAQLEKELKEAQEDFYQNSIRGQASGEYIHVEDSSNCRAKIGIGGNSEQETRSGKNCIPNNLIDGTTNGIKYTIDSDKAINLSGTATARTEPKLFYNTTNPLKFKAGTYKNTSDLLIILRCDTYISIPAKSTVVLSEDKEVIEAYFRIEQGETVSGKHYPQIIVNGQDESYEQYGASPSPDYKSEVKSVGSNGSVKVTICNKNLFYLKDIEKKQVQGFQYSIKNGILKINGTKTENRGYFIIDCDNFILKKGNYTFSINILGNLSGKITMELKDINYRNIVTFEQLNTNCVKQFTIEEDMEVSLIRWWIEKDRAFTNYEMKIQLEKGQATSYEQHQEQSYIIPIQQPMRSIGDIRDKFIKKNNKWYERHNINRRIFDGTTNKFVRTSGTANNLFVTNTFEDGNIIVPSTYGENVQHFNNYFQIKYSSDEMYQNANYVGSAIRPSDDMVMGFGKESEINTVDEANAWLKAKYDAGAPLYVDYLLETPIDIECTEEQSKILEELNNARTYKNVTNITTDSKAILSLDYVKDQETQNQKIQNEIDEIKQLLSTTQTSALLLDNMQTDIESEVK